jgi:hypothetical protein
LAERVRSIAGQAPVNEIASISRNWSGRWPKSAQCVREIRTAALRSTWRLRLARRAKNVEAVRAASAPNEQVKK